jgi:hypothetical protein
VYGEAAAEALRHAMRFQSVSQYIAAAALALTMCHSLFSLCIRAAAAVASTQRHSAFQSVEHSSSSSSISME